jgi:DNA-binding NarL/FixJ family response regulator
LDLERINMGLDLPLSILIADDHRLFRQGLIGLLNTRPDLVCVVGEAATGRECLSLVERIHPDVVLMDIQMPDGGGLQTTQVIRQRWHDVRVVILTASESDEQLYQAVELGVAGYLLKSLDAVELFDLLVSVARGEAALTRAMAARLLKDVARRAARPEEVPFDLTEREINVLHLVAQGATNPEIAERLCISINTVKTHLSSILEKLHLDNRTQAAAYAVQAGLVSPFDPKPISVVESD